jgi:hypothetical protein
MHPPIEGCGTLSAPSAGLDAHLVGNSLYRISQTDFFFDEEAGQPYMVGLMWPMLIGLGPAFPPYAATVAFLAHVPDPFRGWLR